MTVDKAIEILDLNLPTDQWNRDPDQLAALQLGIEALKAIHSIRHHPFPDLMLPLPGETKDEQEEVIHE